MDRDKIIKKKNIYAYPINLIKVPFQYSIDIDNLEDLLMARMIYKKIV